jgi:carboxyl-terminal processing protease
MTYGTQVKVTISRYYFTPAGRCIQTLDCGTRQKTEKQFEPMLLKIQPFKTKKIRTVYDGEFYQIFN